MLEVKLNLWDAPSRGFSALCVTTNGITKANGEAVMGAGIAKQCAEKIPNAPRCLGEGLVNYGNHVQLIGVYGGALVLSFPTKHHWRFKSSLDLIKRSARELVQVFAANGDIRVALPRPGCANGKLDWHKQVKPAIQEILGDQFYICSL